MEVIIIPIEKSLILRARGSELLILDHHVSVLKGLKKSQEFIQYFNSAALVNRAARKLFEAWLRKDSSLWKRIYETIGEMEVEATEASGPVAPKAPIVNPKEEEAPKKTVAKSVEKPKAASESKKDDKKTVVKEAKPTKEAAKPAAKESAKKPAAKAVKKTAAKKTVKKKQTTTAKKKTSSKA